MVNVNPVLRIESTTTDRGSIVSSTDRRSKVLVWFRDLVTASEPSKVKILLTITRTRAFLLVDEDSVNCSLDSADAVVRQQEQQLSKVVNYLPTKRAYKGVHSLCRRRLDSLITEGKLLLAPKVVSILLLVIVSVYLKSVSSD